MFPGSFAGCDERGLIPDLVCHHDQTGALLVASLLVFVDLGFLGWIIALAVVATAAYDAATGGWIEAGLYWRIARRRRP
jgi:hypothetical protein